MGASVATGADRFASRKYQTPAATNTINAAKPRPSGASEERLFGWAGLRLRRLAHFKGIDPDGVGDVLELGRAEIGYSEIKPPFHLTICVLGQTDRAGVGDALKTRGDVDAVAHQVAVALLDHVAEMNADPKFDALVGRDAGVALDHGPSALRWRSAPRRRRCGTR